MLIDRKREKAVGLFNQGLSYSAIAEELGSCKKSVSAYLKSIGLVRLQNKDRGQNHIAFICSHCEKTFFDYPSTQRKFCSLGCKNESMRVWDRDLIILGIKRVAVDGIAKSTDAGASLQKAAIRMFGTWAEACVAAEVSSPMTPNEGACIVDGCDSEPRSPVALYCEKHYCRLYRTGSLETTVDMAVYKECLHCGSKLSGYQRKFCSSRCQARYYRGLPVTRECVWCGEEFVPIEKNIACSDACRSEHNRRVSREYYARQMETNPEYRARMFAAYHARRAAVRSEDAENVIYEEVFERDGWVCQLCGDPIDREAEWPQPLSVSLDHILPLSRGGAHTYDNVQCTHLLCNLSKNNSTVDGGHT